MICCNNSMLRSGSVPSGKLLGQMLRRAVLGAALISCAAWQSGCDRKPPQGAGLPPANSNTASAVAVKPVLSPELVQTSNTQAATDMQSVVSNTLDYETITRGSSLISKALTFGSTNDFTFETISNLVADVPSQLILDIINRTPFSNRPDDPKCMAIMHMYEVVLLRGTPTWASMFARSQLGDFYSYHGSDFPQRDDPWVLKLLAAAELSPDATPAEQGSYVSIQFDLVSRSRGEERLRYIAKVEKLVAQGKLRMPPQPVQMLPLFKATALLQLGREAEARAIVQDLYDRRLSPDFEPTVRGEIEKGVDAFVNMKLYGTDDPKMIEQVKKLRAAGWDF